MSQPVVAGDKKVAQGTLLLGSSTQLRHRLELLGDASQAGSSSPYRYSSPAIVCLEHLRQGVNFP